LIPCVIDSAVVRIPKVLKQTLEKKWPLMLNELSMN
jgi:hypothetical protein